MLKVGNDEYDDELFDSLIQQEQDIKEKAKELGIPFNEALSLMKEMNAENNLMQARNMIIKAQRDFEAMKSRDKADRCKGLSKDILDLLNADRRNVPSAGMY